LTPTVEWQVAGACNYQCSYCIQSPRQRRGQPAAQALDAAVAWFATLPGTWEIKCSGGEAFAHPLFLGRVVPALMDDTPHTISVLTNFSAGEAELSTFLAVAGARLRVFSASLHLEHVAVEAFVAKAAWFVPQLPPQARFVVNQVVFPGREAEALACRARVESAGLREANVAPSYQGRRCAAGVRYLVVDKAGEAWRCRSAKRHGEERLGNVYDGTARLLGAPSPCPYTLCPCTVPANRGMIEGIA
jgi:hypothetical protein